MAKLRTMVLMLFDSHPLLGYSLRRIFYGLVTLLVAIIVVFLLVRAVTDNNQYLPSNIAQLHLTAEQTKQLLTDRMKMFGVYGTMIDQLGNYLRDIFPLIPKTVVLSAIYQPSVSAPEGYVLVSQVTQTLWVYLGVVSSPSIAAPGTSVLALFNQAIPYSFAFGAIAVVISYLIGVPLGVEAAKYKGKMNDNIINSINIVLIAIPGVIIVIGFYLLSIAGLGNPGLYSSGSFWTKFWPVVVLVLLIAPTNVILTRRYVIDEMTSDYTKFAYAKGVGTNRVYYLHIFRNAGIRILKVFPVDLAATLFGASILTEQQWSIPGMGKCIVSAIGGQKDSFVILGYISFAAFIQIFSTLFSDLLMVIFDPRVALTRN